MAQKKLVRFAELETFPNVLQYPENIKGNWFSIFKNHNPLTLELACGKGEYAVGMGRIFPSRNFLGVDQKGNRIWVGAKTCIKENLSNVAFLRTQIDRISEYFTPGEVEEIWITFPDPQLRISKAKKRLTHPKFLRMYQQFLQPGGYINLKTDSPVLYEFTKLVIHMHGLETIFASNDLYKEPNLDPVLRIQTHYEKMDIAQSNRIHYLKFRLPADPLPNLDEQLKLAVIERESD